MSGESFILRGAKPTDLPFIYRSILMGTYHGNKYGKGGKVDPRSPVDYFSSIPQDVFMSGFHAYLDTLFARPVVIVIAALQSDPDVILGFSCYEPGVLHFVFVKPQWRKIGIATQLVPDGITTVTGFTRVGDIIRRKKGLVFNPWA